MFKGSQKAPILWWAILVAILLVSCGPPRAVPSPTLTPLPTFTPTIALPIAPAPPTPSPMVTPTPTRPKSIAYVVQAGDTLSTIATRYGTSIEAIAEANQLKDRHSLQVGQELKIPLPGADVSTEKSGERPTPVPQEWGNVVTYTVKSGDNLGDIAERYGVTVKQLMEDNQIRDERLLQIGQNLVIRSIPVRTPSAGSVEVAYTVRQGDTMERIAGYFSRSIAALMKANNITDATSIRVGQTLIIPPATLTPEAVAIATPALASTSQLPYGVPYLLGPPDGAKFEGKEAAILLNWASVGILEKGEWYLLAVYYEERGKPQAVREWTKSTNWRLPASLYPGGKESPRRFEWEVVVVRETSSQAAGAKEGEIISPQSRRKSFLWQ